MDDHNDDITTGVLSILKLQELWYGYENATVPKEKDGLFLEFLTGFVKEFEETEPTLLRLRYGDTSNLTRSVIWKFLHTLTTLVANKGHTTETKQSKHLSAQLIYEYLSGFSCGGEGLYLLWTIEILTRETSNTHLVAGLATVLITVLTSVLELPSTYLTYKQGQASCPLIPSFCNFSFSYLSTLFSIEDFPECLSFLALHLEIPSVPKSPIWKQTGCAPLSLPQDYNYPHSFSNHAVDPRSHELSTEIPVNSIRTSLCYHLLAILGNLFNHQSTWKELVKSDPLKLETLVDYLSLGPRRKKTEKRTQKGAVVMGMSISNRTMRSHDPDAFGFFVVHRQLIRAMAKLFITACRTRKGISMLYQQRILPSVLENLWQHSDSLSSTIRLELCQLIVFTIKMSTRISPYLLDDFSSYKGYQVLTHNLIAVGKLGTRDQKSLFIALVCHLLFTNDYEPSVAEDDDKGKKLIPNLQSCKVLLDGFANCSSVDMKTDLLYTIHTVLSLRLGYGTTGYEALHKQFKPFKTLFLQFDTLTHSNRLKALEMMDEILEKRYLLDEEMKFYCSLLQGKRPSTLLLVLSHMIKLIRTHQSMKEILRNVGLIPMLSQYLIQPKYLYCAPALKDKKERKRVLKVIKRGKNELLEENEVVSVDELNVPSGKQSLHDKLMNLEGDTAEEKEINQILYTILIKILELMLVLFQDDVSNQQEFCSCSGLQRLYFLLEDSILRESCLRIMATTAIGDASFSKEKKAFLDTTALNGKKKKKAKKERNPISEGIVGDIVGVLQSSGGTATLDPDILIMRRDVLYYLCEMFRHNEILKDCFREKGGFIWSISVMNGIGQSLDIKTEKISEDFNNKKKKHKEKHHSIKVENVPEEAFIFIKMLLNTVSSALKGNPENQKYFRTEIRFAALSEALESCYFIEGTNAIELCDSLLDIAVRGTWPPSCPRYKSITEKLKTPPSEEDIANDFSHSADPDSFSIETHVHRCTLCKDQLEIENSEILKIIVQLLYAALGKTEDAHIVFILNHLNFLTTILPSNKHNVAEVNLVSLVIFSVAPMKGSWTIAAKKKLQRMKKIL